MLTRRLIFIAIPIMIALIPLVIAGCVGIPDLTSQMSHQGRLLDNTGAPVADGSYNFRYFLQSDQVKPAAIFTCKFPGFFLHDLILSC